MTEEEILTTILESSYTKQDLLRRVRLLREYLEHKLFSQKSVLGIEKFLKDNNTSISDIETISSWGSKFLDYFNKENVYDALNYLTEKIKTITTVNIYLPFGPDDKEAARLGKWFRENVRSDALLELHVDRSMVGGVGLASNGYFHDYSLKHYIEKNKIKVNDIINSYAITKV